MPSSSAWRRARSAVELAMAASSTYGSRLIASTWAAPTKPTPTTPTLSGFSGTRAALVALRRQIVGDDVEHAVIVDRYQLEVDALRAGRLQLLDLLGHLVDRPDQPAVLAHLGDPVAGILVLMVEVEADLDPSLQVGLVRPDDGDAGRRELDRGRIAADGGAGIHHPLLAGVEGVDAAE